MKQRYPGTLGGFQTVKRRPKHRPAVSPTARPAGIDPALVADALGELGKMLPERDKRVAEATAEAISAALTKQLQERDQQVADAVVAHLRDAGRLDAAPAVRVRSGSVQHIIRDPNGDIAKILTEPVELDE